jgi:hypothetical protein
VRIPHISKRWQNGTKLEEPTALTDWSLVLQNFFQGPFLYRPIYVNTASRDIVILYSGELVLEGQLQFSREIFELLEILASRLHTKLKKSFHLFIYFPIVPLRLLPDWEEY